MKKLDVYYNGWGERWRLGTVAKDGRITAFEYSPEALARKLELSPFRTPVTPVARTDGPRHMEWLPGLISDSIPDGWGRLLIDRLHRQQGNKLPDALDVLAYVGDQALGALSFAPATRPEETEHVTSLFQIAEHSRTILEGEASEVLPELVRAGGSPHGARPKVMVTLRDDDTITTDLNAPGQQWLVKFAAPKDPTESTKLEWHYANWAVRCGIVMSPAREFPLDEDGFKTAFATARFDRIAGQRVPVFTLASLTEADFRTPGALSYEDVLKVTAHLTRDMSQVEQMFTRCVFNVVFCNMDDHAKNFAFQVDAQGNWSCTPAYDLTYSSGPGGEHNMDVVGKGKEITRADLLKLAQKVGLDVRKSADSIERVVEVASEALALTVIWKRCGIEPYSISAWRKDVASAINRMTP